MVHLPDNGISRYKTSDKVKLQNYTLRKIFQQRQQPGSERHESGLGFGELLGNKEGHPLGVGAFFLCCLVHRD